MNKHKSSAQEDDSNLTVSDRLRYIIDKVGIKQVHLANKLGVTPQAIHQLCAGKQNFSKHSQKIAQLLNANEDWLKTGKGEPFSSNELVITDKIIEFPVYHLSQLDQVKASRARLGSLVPQEKYVTARAYHPESISFYINDTGFSPKFENGDIILVEPTPKEDIKNGSLALIYSQELSKTIFCYFQKNNNALMVGWQPSNNAAPIFFNIQADDLIYGIYRECLKTG